MPLRLKDGPKILKDLSFHVQSGERIGIGESPVKPACPITSYSQPVIAGPHTVGRTGAGKSTLALALLRCIHTDGAAYYDGLPTHGMNLDALRSNVTVIPQVVSASASVPCSVSASVHTLTDPGRDIYIHILVRIMIAHW